MRFRLPFFAIIAAALLLTSCTEEKPPASPKETFSTYTKALKKGDLTTVKLLLSAETKKMHEQEARARGLTLDDIVKNETLINDTQTVVKVRNEVINGDRATLEVENSFGMWETLPFVFEEGQWKIDKKGYADQIQMEIEQTGRELDQTIDDGRIDPDKMPTAEPFNSTGATPQY
ncbi:MAG TPA: hypothetical protein VK918_09605 [Pyrinomonadaceae bacterium]|nr:hypothetical protein [Pyrinomonadaceae bacterium]